MSEEGVFEKVYLGSGFLSETVKRESLLRYLDWDEGRKFWVVEE